MTEHDLKTWPEPFAAILDGSKRHEVRKNDRGFAVGHVLHLREWEPNTWNEDVPKGLSPGPYLGKHTGRTVRVRVTHITQGGQWGIRDDLCVMSIERIVEPPPPAPPGEVDVAEGRRIEAAMTPGPFGHLYMTDQMPPCDDYPTRAITFPGVTGGASGKRPDMVTMPTVADAAGLVYMRNNWTALLDALAAKDAEVARLRAEVADSFESGFEQNRENEALHDQKTGYIEALAEQEKQIASLTTERDETSMLAAFYRSCALSGEDPGDADEARAKVRSVLAERAALTPMPKEG